MFFMDSDLIILFALIFLSGAFSASEIALTSLSEAKVRSFDGDGKFGSRVILRLRKFPQRLLISILVGNQVVNVVATVLATIWVIRIFGEDQLTLSTTVFTLVLILFGSITPKTIALSFPEIFARVLSYPLFLFILIVRPIIWIFEVFIRMILRLLRADTKDMYTLSEREIAVMLDMSVEKGLLEEEEEAFMKHILQFSEVKAEGIMTLLKDIDAIDIKSSREELLPFLQEHEHTNFPVYEDDLNNIKGLISLHKLLHLTYNSRKKFPLEDQRFVSTLVVPKTVSLTELFKEFKEKNQRIAIVVDEYAQTMGLVTLGDILIEITGVRVKKNNDRPQPVIKKLSRNLWEADGDIPLSKINESLGVQLSSPDHKRISLCVLEKLMRFPENGEKVVIDSIEVEVVKMVKNLIKKVQIKKVKR